MCRSEEQLLDCAQQLMVSNLKSVGQCSYLQLQMQVRHPISLMKKCSMQQTQCLSLGHKPLRSESHRHRSVANTAQEDLQTKGIPVLL